MKVQCPNCQVFLKVPEHYIGKKAKCLKCNYSFEIKLPQQTETEETAPPKQPEPTEVKPKDNIFIKLWNNSPLYFRNSFLATLGVISALVFAYYMISIPKFINRETTQKAGMVYSSSSDLKLAACILLQNYNFKFEALSNVRANAAREFLDKEAGLYAFLSVIKVTESQLEELYTQVHKLNIPNDETLQLCYHSLLDAIDTEYAFQKSLLPYIQNPNSLRALSKVQDFSKKAVNKSNEASITITLLLSEIDHNLWEKMLYIWNTD